jgi:hypothetical protein
MKLKTIYINEDLHAELKSYCAQNKLKLNAHIEKVLQKHGTVKTISAAPKSQS